MPATRVAKNRGPAVMTSADGSRRDEDDERPEQDAAPTVGVGQEAAGEQEAGGRDRDADDERVDLGLCPDRRLDAGQPGRGDRRVQARGAHRHGRDEERPKRSRVRAEVPDEGGDGRSLHRGRSYDLGAGRIGRRGVPSARAGHRRRPRSRTRACGPVPVGRSADPWPINRACISIVSSWMARVSSVLSLSSCSSSTKS